MYRYSNKSFDNLLEILCDMLPELNTILKCRSSRWKVDGRTKQIHKGSPAKVLTYFPIIPRFRRMFESPKMVRTIEMAL